MRVSHVMLQNALEWLHGCYMGVVLGRKPEHETLCFSCKVAAAGDGGQLVCDAGVGRSFWCFFVATL